MTPETFVDEVRKALPTGVRSIVLYGSAVAGDHLGKRSDYNILIILERVGMEELRAMSVPTKAWVNAGSHPPNVFTMDELRQSADVFPIEFLDILDSHKILWGDDVTKQIMVSDANLRTQVEHELKGKLIQLRAEFLLTGTKPKQLVALMTGTVAKFLILFRAALRLYEQKVPAPKLDALRALGRHIALDVEVFMTIQELKEERKKAGDGDAEALFGRYLRAIETVTNAVEGLRKGAGK